MKAFIGTLLLANEDGFFPPFNGQWLTYLTLLFSVIAICLALFRLQRRKGHVGSPDSPGEFRQEFKNKLQEKIGRSEFEEFGERLKRIEDRLKQMEQPAREVVWDSFASKVIAPETEPDDDVALPLQELLFAKLADLDEGFSSGIISTVQNGEQIYEIQTDGETAVYRISDDPSAQKYALSEANYTLGKACEFVNPPFRGCKIVQLKEGSLIKSSGNWIIQEKAKIEFR